MHLPRDVFAALKKDGVYRAPISPVDSDREVAHHLCAIVAIAHAYPFNAKESGMRLSPVMQQVIQGVQDALGPYLLSTGEGVPDRLVQP
jgi:hypothetical protein